MALHRLTAARSTLRSLRAPYLPPERPNGRTHFGLSPRTSVLSPEGLGLEHHLVHRAHLAGQAFLDPPPPVGPRVALYDERGLRCQLPEAGHARPGALHGGPDIRVEAAEDRHVVVDADLAHSLDLQLAP